MSPEILVYGIPAGQTERYTEALLATKCRTEADIERVKVAASAEGFHDFRVTTWNGDPPDFRSVLNRT